MACNSKFIKRLSIGHLPMYIIRKMNHDMFQLHGFVNLHLAINKHTKYKLLVPHCSQRANSYSMGKARKCDLRLQWCHEAGWKLTVNCNIYNSISWERYGARLMVSIALDPLHLFEKCKCANLHFPKGYREPLSLYWDLHTHWTNFLHNPGIGILCHPHVHTTLSTIWLSLSWSLSF